MANQAPQPQRSTQSEINNNYDAIVLAVSHNEFLEIDLQQLKSNIGVIFDVKSLLPKHTVDARL